MVIFHSYVSLPEGILKEHVNKPLPKKPFFPGITIPSGGFFAQRLAAQVGPETTEGWAMFLDSWILSQILVRFFSLENTLFFGGWKKHDVLQIVL